MRREKRRKLSEHEVERNGSRKMNEKMIVELFEIIYEIVSIDNIMMQRLASQSNDKEDVQSVSFDYSFSFN